MTPPHQLGPFLVSKYAIPAVVFVQYWAQLRYPSPRNLALRKALLALYGAAAIAMAFQSACTDVIRARWPRAHDTLRWGGYDGAAAPILVVAALTAGNFAVCVEREHPRILAALVLPFVGVITFLWSTEGTLALGSKWCTGLSHRLRVRCAPSQHSRLTSSSWSGRTSLATQLYAAWSPGIITGRHASRRPPKSTRRETQCDYYLLEDL